MKQGKYSHNHQGKLQLRCWEATGDGESEVAEVSDLADVYSTCTVFEA